MDELIEVIENEKNKRFNRPWTKLDKGSKLNRILIFIKEEKEKNDLNEEESKKLKKLLFHSCDNGLLNKVGDVEYEENEKKIIFIKNLIYGENDKKYSFNLPKKIIKPSSKSKSNIDRHFSRSKENKR